MTVEDSTSTAHIDAVSANRGKSSKGGPISLGILFIIAAVLLTRSSWFSARIDELTAWASGNGKSTVATGSATPAKAKPTNSAKTTGKPTSSGTPAPTPAATPAASSAALTQLNSLKVLATRPNPSGYQRGCSPSEACTFGPAWTDDTTAPDGHNGCGSRDDALKEQLEPGTVKLKSGSKCVVASGILDDPYTGKKISWVRGPDSATVQIDHLVPLALAYDLGANTWTQAQRNAYANDTKTVLIAADGPENMQKSDSGPANWMPSNKDYWCTYDSRFVAVLVKYELPVVESDKVAMAKVLATCS